MWLVFTERRTPLVACRWKVSLICDAPIGECQAWMRKTVSFDLVYWYENAQSTPGRAAEIYDRLADGEEGVVPRVPAIDDFFAEIVAMFGDLTEDGIEESPWAARLYRTPECVIVNLAYSRSEEVAPVLRSSASKHRLTAYDPQNQQVHPPVDSQQTEAPTSTRR